MKFVTVSILVAFSFAVGVDAGSLNLANNGLTLNGNANVQFYGQKEEVWAGLSNGRRYPIINSGDTIALRLAYTSGSASQYWMRCATTCQYYTCPGKLISSSHWSSCSNRMRFKITAMGKMEGHPINSGDIVSLSSEAYGTSYRLRCDRSDSSKCYVSSTISTINGNSWFRYSWVTFQIFSRSAVDGTPVQYADVVGFKYVFGGFQDWLYYYGGYFYSRPCSYYNKWSCAKENTYTGFKIFKKL